MASNERLEKALRKVPASRRAAIKGMVVGAAFVVPYLTSFPMDGRVSLSRAQSGNAS